MTENAKFCVKRVGTLCARGSDSQVRLSLKKERVRFFEMLVEERDGGLHLSLHPRLEVERELLELVAECTSCVAEHTTGRACLRSGVQSAHSVDEKAQARRGEAFCEHACRRAGNRLQPERC